MGEPFVLAKRRNRIVALGALPMGTLPLLFMIILHVVHFNGR